jgi:hypothetical protein
MFKASREKNLTAGEFKDIGELKGFHHKIIIKQADKGGISSGSTGQGNLYPGSEQTA